jgi:uncharacterized protein (DUF2267 family)
MMSKASFHKFDHTLQEAHSWLNEVAENLGNPNRQLAYHALRGVLFALRDRLTVDEVFDLSAQLPMLIRGLFFEGYQVMDKPEKFHAEEFLARVAEELHTTGGGNPERAVRAVLTVLQSHVAKGEIDEVIAELPKDIRRLWPDFTPV